MIVFLFYDFLVHRRNERLVANAARSQAVVSSLFPGKMRDRVLQMRGTKGKMRSLVAGQEDMDIMDGDKPLADLFLGAFSSCWDVARPSTGSHFFSSSEVTVLFADIAGFTAWSSVREPSQVFTLLESVYSNFDELAVKRKVFKVEVSG